MLTLKCSVCLEVLKTLESRPMAAPCGHIYCQTCLQSMSQTRPKTNCAFCRHPFPINAAIKLFVEYQETQLVPAPPLTVTQKDMGKALIEACARVGDDAEEQESLETIVSAEKLLMSIEGTHGDTDAEHLLKLVNVSLGDFRKRLKLFSRMNTLQQKNAELELDRVSLRRAVIDQLKEADEAAQTKSKLERRLKRTSAELERFQSRERQDQEVNSQLMREMHAKLQAEMATSIKYKKKCFITLQKLKTANSLNKRPKSHARSAAGLPTSETEISDDSLEIISPSGSHKHSNTAMKASLRRQISGSSTARIFDDLEGKRKAATTDGEDIRVSRSLHKRIKRPKSPDLNIVQESHT